MRREFGSGGSPLAVVLRLELRHRNIPITHSLANRSIAKALSEAGAKVTYEEGEGIHDWYFWDTYIQHVLKWLNYSAERK